MGIGATMSRWLLAIEVILAVLMGLTRKRNPEIHPTRVVWSAQTMTAVAALLVAGAVLGTTIWQGYETRRHNRLSVQPAMTFEQNPFDTEPFIGITLANVGLGVAIVKPFRISHWDEDGTSTN